VSCDEAFLEIGESLRDALQYLRKPRAPRVLWIDRIAINQEDLKERAAQVELMADIYSLASEVPVWLGRAGGNTDLAFRCINDLAGKMLTFWKSKGSNIPKSGEDPRISNHPIRYPSIEDQVWLAIRALLQRPWFSRVWTFQEIVLARIPVLICGPHSIKWDMLEAFLLGLMIYPEGPNSEDSRLRGAELYLREITKARLLQHRLEANPPKDTKILLLPLLDSLRNRQSSDPRDKVFALLNIAQDVKSSPLKVDYDKSLADVYIMTARWLLQTQRKLSFLSMVEKKDKPDLISWVPDFRYKDAWNFLHQQQPNFRGNPQIFYASGSSRADVVKHESGNTLTVHGILVGTVIARTEPPGNFANSSALGLHLQDGEQWPLFARSCAVKNIYPATGEPIDLAYQRLCIWDTLPHEWFTRSRRQRARPPKEIPRPGPVSYNQALGGLVHGSNTDIAMSILRGTTRKRMFRTDTGYLGLAHRSVEVNDKVFVLMGGDAPFVLRPFGSKFFGFGGECYVHGIMDGEMLGIAKAREEGGKVGQDLKWIDELRDRPWPFKTEELILV
jgi:hypothetical protein